MGEKIQQKFSLEPTNLMLQLFGKIFLNLTDDLCLDGAVQIDSWQTQAPSCTARSRKSLAV
jgi:hypothetical protein